jgi:quinol monooxygenase YgiN
VTYACGRFLLNGENAMYALTGTLLSHAGKRNELIEILLHASDVVSQFPGCHAYIVNEDVGDETRVLVFEIWENKEAHDASLKDERVRSLIAQAMPFLGGPLAGTELRVVGGYGINF